MATSLPSHQAKRVHILFVPFPAQGHIGPAIKLANKLTALGCTCTVLTTETIYSRITNSSILHESHKNEQKQVTVIPVPDGLTPEEDRRDEAKLFRSIIQVMPLKLQELIEKIDVTCVVADSVFGWALDVAKRTGVKQAVLFVSSPGVLAMISRLPRLIESGLINAVDGTMTGTEMIQLSPNLPGLTKADFTWNVQGDEFSQREAFRFMLNINRTLKSANWVLCNWFDELDPTQNETLLPNIVPCGPLLSNETYFGNLWSEDLSCLNWLDKFPPRSVIFAAFGSTSKFNQTKFEELVFGLELAKRPFLLVVRPDFCTNTDYPKGFMEKTGTNGKIVQWAPQEKVLAHNSIACYLTHSGYNSVIESITFGVPMLCWPYFGDQFYIKTCLCYGWRVGIELVPDQEGVVSRNQIKNKLEELVADDGIRRNALKLKELARKSITKDGSSCKNLEKFVAQLMH